MQVTIWSNGKGKRIAFDSVDDYVTAYNGYELELFWFGIEHRLFDRRTRNAWTLRGAIRLALRWLEEGSEDPLIAKARRIVTELADTPEQIEAKREIERLLARHEAGR